MSGLEETFHEFLTSVRTYTFSGQVEEIVVNGALFDQLSSVVLSRMPIYYKRGAVPHDNGARTEGRHMRMITVGGSVLIRTANGGRISTALQVLEGLLQSDWLYMRILAGRGPGSFATPEWETRFARVRELSKAVLLLNGTEPTPPLGWTCDAQTSASQYRCSHPVGHVGLHSWDVWCTCPTCNCVFDAIDPGSDTWELDCPSCRGRWNER